MGIEGVDNLVHNLVARSREAMTNSLKDCFRLQNTVARLYLSIARKIEGRNSSSARHLLRVFCDSPFLARTLLLPDLWEHLFLQHLLHIRIWYNIEVESISISENFGDDIELKSLSKLYNERMDTDTAHFAAYCMNRLKVGAKAPPVPEVALRLKHRHGELSRKNSSEHRRGSIGSAQRRKSMDSCTSNSTVDKNLYRAAFDSKQDTQMRSSACFTNGRHAAGNGQIECSAPDNYLPDDVRRATISTICCSDILSECEAAIHTVMRAWLGSHGDRVIGSGIRTSIHRERSGNPLRIQQRRSSRPGAIIFRRDCGEERGQRPHILNFTPQLDVFVRLLRRNSIFLKAAALLYLLKLRTKLMISTEWVSLVLRVLEFSDQTQILFKFRCVPRIAAFYFLIEILLGFDKDKNSENARELVSFGGLSVLMKIFESGPDQNEMKDI